ncbi:MAG: DUF1707 domain-containing protein [Actinomycetota bacterium]|nr:DUF1707 domain-containing protein [Actinomycetota bacterium]
MSNVPERPGEWTGRTPIRSGAHQRVSDAERDAVVEQLRLNMADGRLDIDEYGERVATALAARTGADLQAVLADLPQIVPPEEAVRKRRASVRAIVTPYLVVNLFLVLIWAVGGFGYFWPVWPILGWGLGVVLSLSAVAGRDGRHDRHGRERHRRRDR